MYTDFYGLSDRPFLLTPDARFYFESGTHKKAMAYLGYGLSQGEGFIVITGDIGAGKSTLVQHLLGTIDRSRLNAISLVSTQVDGDDMLRLAAQGMGIATEGLAKAQLLERVEQWLEAQAHTRKRTLLIVDEAQNLSVSALEELRMMSNYQNSGQALLQILLLGQPEFRDMLADSDLEQLRQRVIATHHLDPMEADEVEPYMLHRLALVGWNGRPAFDAEAFAAIYRETDGLPRRINQLASRLMLHAGVEQMEMIGADAVAAVVADIAEDSPPPRERVLPLRSASRPRAVPTEQAVPAEQAVQADHAVPAEQSVQTEEAVQEVVQTEETVPTEQAVPTEQVIRTEIVADASTERRIAALEARLEEQERALRRVLTLLVDWVESGEQAPSYRHNAA